MTIETKFNVGDVIWITNREREPERVTITAVKFLSNESGHESYRKLFPEAVGLFYIHVCRYLEIPVSVSEELCFATREELIASL